MIKRVEKTLDTLLFARLFDVRNERGKEERKNTHSKNIRSRIIIRNGF